MGMKQKIINDPVFGFINLPTGFLYQVYQHPYLYRLSRIQQLGLSFWYTREPGIAVFNTSPEPCIWQAKPYANYASKAMRSPRPKQKAPWLPLCCTTSGTGLFPCTGTGFVQRAFARKNFSLADGAYEQRVQRETRYGHRHLQRQLSQKFLHQLISSQLDVDRLDYLRRDSFFTGVVEGNIGSSRIIKMLAVCEDRLVVEAKGIYSIENFLMARRLMYWQVYLHKTSLAAEKCCTICFTEPKYSSRQVRI